MAIRSSAPAVPEPPTVGGIDKSGYALDGLTYSDLAAVPAAFGKGAERNPRLECAVSEYSSDEEDITERPMVGKLVGHVLPLEGPTHAALPGSPTAEAVTAGEEGGVAAATRAPGGHILGGSGGDVLFGAYQLWRPDGSGVARVDW